MSTKITEAGKETFNEIQKSFVLQLLDQHWKEHLLNLDHLRQGINLRAFGQRDPLNEYKTEAFSLFETMLFNLRENVTQTTSLVEVNIDARVIERFKQRDLEQPMNEGRQDPALMGTGSLKQANEQKKVQPFPNKKPFDNNDPMTWGKVQRNAPCPCGSGKKFKHCHGKIV